MEPAPISVQKSAINVPVTFKLLNILFNPLERTLTLKEWVLLQSLSLIGKDLGDTYFKLLLGFSRNSSSKEIRELITAATRDSKNASIRSSLGKLFMIANSVENEWDQPLSSFCSEKSVDEELERKHINDCVHEKLVAIGELVQTHVKDRKQNLEDLIAFYDSVSEVTPVKPGKIIRITPVTKTAKQFVSESLKLRRSQVQSLEYVSSLLYKCKPIPLEKLKYHLLLSCSLLKTHFDKYDKDQKTLDAKLAQNTKTQKKTTLEIKFDEQFENLKNLMNTNYQKFPNHIKPIQDYFTSVVNMIKAENQYVQGGVWLMAMTLTVMCHDKIEDIDHVLPGLKNITQYTFSEKGINVVDALTNGNYGKSKLYEAIINDGPLRDVESEINKKLENSIEIYLSLMPVLEQILTRVKKKSSAINDDDLSAFEIFDEIPEPVVKEEVDEPVEQPEDEIEEEHTVIIAPSTPWIQNVRESLLANGLTEASDLLLQKLPKHFGNQKQHLCEVSDHAYLACVGFERLYQALQRHQLQDIGGIFSMLLLDWHIMLERLLPNQSSHSLVELFHGTNLTFEEKQLMFNLSHAVIWSRYPHLSWYRFKQPAEGKKWLHFSLDFQVNFNSEKLQSQLPEFIQFVVDTHISCFRFMYKLLGKNTKIENERMGELQTLLKEFFRPLLTGTVKCIQKENSEVKIALDKINQIMKSPALEPRYAGIVCSALEDCKSHLLRLKCCLNSHQNLTWDTRNLMNIQWVIETLYLCRYFLKSHHEAHIHDFKTFQMLLGDEDAMDQKLLKFNFGIGIHYTRTFAQKKEEAFVRFCKCLDQERESRLQGNKTITSDVMTFDSLKEGLVAVNRLLDKLIAEGNFVLKPGSIILKP